MKNSQLFLFTSLSGEGILIPSSSISHLTSEENELGDYRLRLHLNSGKKVLVKQTIEDLDSFFTILNLSAEGSAL